jgi:hypothetical protein
MKVDVYLNDIQKYTSHIAGNRLIPNFSDYLIDAV